MKLLVIALARRAAIRVKSPFGATDESEPEPDLLVVPRADYSGGHPTKAFWVIEVSGSSARKDRSIKSEIYAAAGVPEYWLVDLEQNRIEVRSDPDAGSYRQLKTFSREDRIASLSFPDVVVTGRELLP